MSQTGNTCCRFVEVVERLPKCPCDCVPPIPVGPSCPFKPTGESFAPALQELLWQNGEAQMSDCPLVDKSRGQPSDDQLCVFSRPGPIDFKSLPRFQCSCVQGTCPELAKNVIRSLGFDPMCSCPCPKTVKPLPPPEAPKKHKRRKKDRSKSNAELSKHDELPSTAASEAPLGLSSAAQSASAAGAPLPSTTASGMVGFRRISSPDAHSGSSNGSLLIEGRGFKIYEIDGEKILFNYSTKNCHLLKCKCSRKDEGSCGCSEWVRLTKYRNCVCPGARKIKKSPPLIQKTGEV